MVIRVKLKDLIKVMKSGNRCIVASRNYYIEDIYIDSTDIPEEVEPHLDKKVIDLDIFTIPYYYLGQEEEMPLLYIEIE